MSDKVTTISGNVDGANSAEVKGKGKAIEQHQEMSMDEEESSEEEAAEEVSPHVFQLLIEKRLQSL